METIQMLGSLGEFVGAIAVVATLVYLAIQVRHSKEAMQANTKSLDESQRLAVAQAYQARTDMQHEALIRQIDSPYLPEIILKAREEGSLEALTAEETFRLRSFYQATFIRLDDIHFQYQHGFLEEELWRSTMQGVVKGTAPMWQKLGLVAMRPAFRQEVERILAEEEEQS